MTLFKGKITKGNLYPFCCGVNAIVDECKVNIGMEGIVIDEVDPANICRVSVKIPSELFESYELSQTSRPAIDLINYSEIISDLDDDSTIQFELISPYRVLTKINHTVYKLDTLHPVSIRKTPKCFELTDALNLTVPLGLLKEGVEAIEKIHEEYMLIGVDFTKHDPIFFMKSYDDDDDNASTEIELSNLPITHVWDGQDMVIQSLYTVEYMSDIVKGLSAFKNISSDNVLLELGYDSIIQIIMKNDLTGAELKYSLAPRIENINSESVIHNAKK